MFPNNALYFAYYPFVIVAFIYMLFSVGFNRQGLFIVALFWSGMFQYLSSSFSATMLPMDIFNVYKITMSMWALYMFGPEVFRTHSKQDVLVNIAWILFSIGYWMSYLKYGGGIVTMMSQYLFKYGLIILLYYAMKSVFIHGKSEYVKTLIMKILYVQVALSVIKIILSISLTGSLQEYIVGSISAGGAGVAVVLPISALAFYWLVNGKRLSSKKSLTALLFLLIAVASGKRTPIFIFPAVYLGLAMYSSSKLRPGALLRLIPLLFLAFYLGVRTNLTLNPERSNWGSFDLEYIYRYALNYNFGVQEYEDIFRDDYDSTGRGAGAFLVFQPRRLGIRDWDEFVLGKGLYESATGVHGRLIGDTGAGASGYGIEHVGLVGGAPRKVYNTGYLGFIGMLVMSIAILANIKDRKLMRVLVIVYVWELFFYGDQLLTQHTSVIIVAYLCFHDRWRHRNQLTRLDSQIEYYISSRGKRSFSPPTPREA